MRQELLCRNKDLYSEVFRHPTWCDQATEEGSRLDTSVSKTYTTEV